MLIRPEGLGKEVLMMCLRLLEMSVLCYDLNEPQCSRPQLPPFHGPHRRHTHGTILGFATGSVVRDLDVFTVFVYNAQRHDLLVAKFNPESSSPRRTAETFVQPGPTLKKNPELAGGSRGGMINNTIDLLWSMTKHLATLICKVSQLCRTLGY